MSLARACLQVKPCKRYFHVCFLGVYCHQYGYYIEDHCPVLINTVMPPMIRSQNPSGSATVDVQIPHHGGQVFDRCTFIIRQFQPKDTPQVHALMLEGLVYGSFWILFGPDNVHRLGGAALCVPSAAPFFYSRWSITNFFLEVCAIALKADLADITAAYKLSLQLSAKVKSAWVNPPRYKTLKP
ncbi:hypothetical protein B0H14DRAFT_3145272 [Mycena olivaceomarginata]|nr:hypothetical protein B0H14DRAFT_3145272 [Mycena olivaceomarginata]